MHNTRPLSKTHKLHDVDNGESRQGKKKVTSGQTYMHAQHKTMPFSKTHWLMMAKEGADKERKR